MIMVLIVAVGAQSIFLVVSRVAWHALVGVYGPDLGAHIFLFYRRIRVFGVGSHS